MIKVKYVYNDYESIRTRSCRKQKSDNYELYIAPFIYLFVEIKESDILHFVVDTIIIHGKYMHSFVSKPLETIFKVPVPCLSVTAEKLI